MLNLQTVTEDLGTACNGKVWIVVTSQQDIDSITKTKGNDSPRFKGGSIHACLFLQLMSMR